jgi:hypothetical protein
MAFIESTRSNYALFLSQKSVEKENNVVYALTPVSEIYPSSRKLREPRALARGQNNDQSAKTIEN